MSDPSVDDLGEKIETIKEMMARWENEPDFQALCLKLNLWAALEREGFSDIHLRCEPYEAQHGVSLSAVDQNIRARRVSRGRSDPVARVSATPWEGILWPPF